VVNHDTGKVIWIGEGKSADVLKLFFERLSAEQLATIEIVSMDLSAAFQKAVREALPSAQIVFDKFHVAKLAQQALDEVRRALVHELPAEDRKALKKSRWVLLRRPDTAIAVEDEERAARDEAKLSEIQKANVPMYRGYLLKESLLELLDAPNRDQAESEARSWLAWASRSRLKPFVRLAKTIRRHLDGVLLAVQCGLTNARLEGTNNKIRMLSHRAFGFHSAKALIATIYLCCSGIDLPVPLLV